MDIKACTEEYWDAFVDASPQGTVFNKSFFLKSYGLPVKYLVCQKGAETVAGFGFVEHPTGIKTMPYSVLSGIIFKDLTGLNQYTVNETMFYALEAFAADLFENYQEVAFNNHWDVKDMRAFDWLNYHERDKGYYQMIPRYTSLVDISNPTDTGEYAHKRRIPELKKGVKEGHTFETRDIQDVELLDRLVDMNYQRQGLTRSENDSRYLRDIASSLLKNNAAKLIATYMNGEPAVVTCFAYDKHRAYYLFVGTDLEYRDWGVGTKNFYESGIRLNRELGLNEIDMVGINSPLRASYKLSFGGSIVPYFLIKKVLPNET